ncbi:nucleotide exchange factor GrpE [Actinomyces sp. B33]|uniref:nucleotide exchange factor GrpE n=1 Tax=Actinomyces sp. B33 TaxID=2942131 RepID=UPI0023405AD8|nr:nucleotide exchange factor GrpE [Actinomyces sp. B33]MDC4232265.1 nucleotide exchange factor GrpE [Actinomyces sp. B33]
MTDTDSQGFEPAPDEGAAGTDPAGSVPAGDGDRRVVEPDGPSAPPEDDPVDMSAFEDDVEDSDLAAALNRIAEIEDQLARANADLYNLGQEYANYVRRSKEAAPAHREAGQTEVIEALIGVLDDIDAARAHGDLADGPFAAIAVKLEDALASRFGLERFGAVGDDFDPQLHEALMAQTSAEVDHPVIAQILQPGYRRGDRVLRATKVMVDNPE